MRNTGIEIEIDETLIPDNIKKELDIEYWKEKDQWTLWIHSDGFKPFLKEYFQYMNAVISVYNRITKSDHLNLYIESESIDEFGIEIEDKKYKNIKFEELKNNEVDISKIKLNKEL